MLNSGVYVFCKWAGPVMNLQAHVWIRPTKLLLNLTWPTNTPRIHKIEGSHKGEGKKQAKEENQVFTME